MPELLRESTLLLVFKDSLTGLLGKNNTAIAIFNVKYNNLMFPFQFLIIIMSIIQFSSSQLPKSSTFYKKWWKTLTKTPFRLRRDFSFSKVWKFNDKTNNELFQSQWFARKIIRENIKSKKPESAFNLKFYLKFMEISTFPLTGSLYVRCD